MWGENVVSLRNVISRHSRAEMTQILKIGLLGGRRFKFETIVAMLISETCYVMLCYLILCREANIFTQ